jgi:DNA-binding Lrp family transcriptional regulator
VFSPCPAVPASGALIAIGQPDRVWISANRHTSYRSGMIRTMTSNGHVPTLEGTLQPAGLSELEELVYRQLLRDPRASLSQLSTAVGRSAVVTRRALDRLETAGLISRQGKPARFIPAAPDMAIEALILRRQEELERCRLTAAALLGQYRNARDTVDVVELIGGRDASLQRYVQLLGSARSEVLMFDKPPYLGPADNPLEMDALARGVTWRAIYAPEAFEPPERLAQLRTWQAAGEQARVCAQVPIKLLIVDRSVALLPLTADARSAEQHTAILVHPSSLLTTLLMLFDMLWEQSLPLDSRGATTPAAGHDDFDRTLLQLLTAGVKDQAIARQLGVSLRTVRRRLSHLMAQAGVVSRFQLGTLAAQRGWV